MGTACYSQDEGTCEGGPDYPTWGILNKNYDVLKFSRYTQQWCLDGVAPIVGAAVEGDEELKDDAEEVPEDPNMVGEDDAEEGADDTDLL